MESFFPFRDVHHHLSNFYRKSKRERESNLVYFSVPFFPFLCRFSMWQPSTLPIVWQPLSLRRWSKETELRFPSLNWMKVKFQLLNVKILCVVTRRKPNTIQSLKPNRKYIEYRRMDGKKQKYSICSYFLSFLSASFNNNALSYQTRWF